MITQAQFTAFKNDAISRQPIRKRISLSDLKFHTMDTVEFSGLTLGINRSGLKDIIRIIGLSQSATTMIEQSVGEATALNILNSLKSVIGGVRKEVTIVVTPDRVITKVTPIEKTSIISTETFFDTYERLANDHNLTIKNMAFNAESGSVSINAIAEKGQHQIAGLSDEVFQTGFSFSRNLEGIQLDPFQERMICTNGMVTRQFEETYKLRSMDPKMWQDFYQHLDRIEKSGFVPQKFNEAVLRSIETPASLFELERGVTLLQSNSNIDEGELEIFFRGLKHTYTQLNRSGILTENLSETQKRNCRTGVNRWDLINGITDFASHNYGYEKKPNSDRHLQVVAGDLLSKFPDTANLITNQPF